MKKRVTGSVRSEVVKVPVDPGVEESREDGPVTARKNQGNGGGIQGRELGLEVFKLGLDFLEGIL